MKSGLGPAVRDIESSVPGQKEVIGVLGLIQRAWLSVCRLETLRGNVFHPSRVQGDSHDPNFIGIRGQREMLK
jgi:hypothetical protein